ncbi:unnamed protein product [Rotaria sordida]|uniref:Uncharacterized protein n=1 Tax=Rotaria sordida TaxID=392033 RepID=A0A815L1G1_9BILA|nr:unnamed protein product [Rotaria sordida]CAF3993791.1 unnamed protein product [Rotaria sordida]
MIRDIAPRLNYPKATLIHSTFFQHFKINKHAFNGGKETIEEYHAKGGDCEVDVSFQYLRSLMDDAQRLEQIRQDYSLRKLLTDELKKILIEFLQELVGQHQEQRKEVTLDVVRQFMTRRQLHFH